MSDDDEALRLNTLHRFRKFSPRLLLEEYSHCEVPAGCGGVVLRWIDPSAATPAVIRVFAEAQLSSWLNGVAIESGRVDLRPGMNVLALALEQVQQPEPSRIGSVLARSIGRDRAAPLLVSILRALGNDPVSGPRSVVLLASGQGRATWRVHDREPSPSWTLPEFDDREWATPRRATLSDEQRSNWRVGQLLEHGAAPLAVPGEQAWVRVHFDVPPLQTRERRGTHA